MKQTGLVGKEGSGDLYKEEPKIQTVAEWATRVKDGVYKGIQTGSLYDKDGVILTKTTKLLTTADTKRGNKD